MTLDSLSVRSFVRELRAPLMVRRHTLTQREGFWLELESQDGSRFRSECAPLPGWHAETQAEVEELVFKTGPLFCDSIGIEKTWSWSQPYFGQWVPAEALPPSLQTSFESLILQKYLSQHRWDLGRNSLVPSHLSIAALLGDRRDLDRRTLFQQYWSEGYRTFKVKVGSEHFLEDIGFLDDLTEEQKHQLRLRIDWNQASALDVETCLQVHTKACVEYWEEPSAAFAEVLQSAHAKRAVDEGLIGRDPDRGDWPEAEVLVLKPSSIGLQRFLRWMILAPLKGKQVVLSNCYEAEPTLQFYAWLYGSFVKEPLALGFGTLKSFREPWPADPFGGNEALTTGHHEPCFVFDWPPWVGSRRFV